MGDQQLTEWIKLAMRNEDIIDYNVNIEGKTNKGEGYLSNISFVTVSGNTANGTKKEYNLVMKSSEARNKLRKQIPIEHNFKTEIYVYDYVKPAYAIQQNDKIAKNLLEFLPNCYATQIAPDMGEMLILENIKPEGYDVWDRKVPITLDHIRLILEAYGKWHAFSFVLKTEKPEDFANLVKNNKNIFGYFVLKVKMVGYMLECFEKARNGAILPHEEEVLNQLQFSEDDIRYIFSGLYEEDPAHRDNTKNPTSLRILDWQCAAYASPVMDLSYFIYYCCDTGYYQDVEELLKIYYSSLNQSLRLFGYSADDIFS